MGVGDFHDGEEFLQQRRELKFGEQLAQGFDVGLSHLHRVYVQLDGGVAIDGGQFFAKQHRVAIVLQRLTISFLFDFRSALQSLLNCTEAFDEFDGTFVTDAGSAGNIVDGVAAQSHHVYNALRRDAENFFDFLGIANQIIFGRIQHQDTIIHQLQHVLVAGNDVYPVRLFDGFAGQGSDYVVGLVSGEFEDGDAVGFQGTADVGQLLCQVAGHFRTVGFVSGIFYFLE